MSRIRLDDDHQTELIDRERPLEIHLQVLTRPCTKRDLQALEWEGLFTLHQRIIQDTFHQQQQGKGLMLLAEAKGRPIGQVWIDWTKKAEQRTAILWAFRVIPWLQGSGIGTRLLTKAEEIARRMGCMAVEAGVEKWNRSAARLYRTLGYKKVGELKEKFQFVQPDGRLVRREIDEWLMKKELPKPINTHFSVST